MLDRRFAVAARRRRVLDSLVRRIAESSVEAICQLIGDRTRSMSVCEARGYVRARAAAEIRRQARLAFSQQPGVDAAWEPLVILRATERAAPLALRQLAAERAAHKDTTSHRRAA
jgi:hypothetical protein